MIVGITGISGSGKSMISREICKVKNAEHVNADSISKRYSMKRRRVLSKNSRCFWK